MLPTVTCGNINAHITHRYASIYMYECMFVCICMHICHINVYI